jgi:hypothetical protein
MWLVSTPEVEALQKEKVIDSARTRYEKYLRAIASGVGEGTLHPWKDNNEIQLAGTHFESASVKTQQR